MHNTIDDVRSYFINELFCRNFTEDRTGGKTIELLGASFLASENAIFGKPNQDYIDAEIDCYYEMGLGILDFGFLDFPGCNKKFMPESLHFIYFERAKNIFLFLTEEA